MTLFENQVVDLEPLVKAAMNRVAERAKAERNLSREQLVDKMNEIAAASGIKLNRNARTLSLDIFEKWLNPASDYMPVRLFLTHDLYQPAVRAKIVENCRAILARFEKEETDG